VRDADELARILDLRAQAISAGASGAFPLRVPRPYLARIRRGDPRDPLLLQVLPGELELEVVDGWVDDPLAETDPAVAVVPGVLRKYRHRALLVTTGSCAVHCRYCFRRSFPYDEARWSVRRGEALAWLREHDDVHELILSGGDPLTLTDTALASLVAEIESVPHLRRLRIHTRLPVVLPARVDGALLAWVERCRLPLAFVLHVNHPREIDEDVRIALSLLRRRGVQLLNQAVLLAGVNDRTEVLVQLSETLYDAGVLPYYLHLMDRVRGAAHFDVPEEGGRSLIAALRERLPGYLVPRLVREQAGAGSKTPID
jgi:EF-P beta-lysylation protein EpmB